MEVIKTSDNLDTTCPRCLSVLRFDCKDIYDYVGIGTYIVCAVCAGRINIDSNLIPERWRHKIERH